MKGLLAYDSKDAGAELSTTWADRRGSGDPRQQESHLCEYETKYTAEDDYAALSSIFQAGAERHL